MVRLNFYDNNETKHQSKGNGEKLNVASHKDYFNLNLEVNPAFSSLTQLRGYSDGKTRAPSCGGVAGSGGDSAHREGVIESQEGEVTRTAEEEEDGVGRVWSNFLEGTSLHGCKNVKEKDWLTRSIWSFAILGMTAALVAAFVSIVVRYNSHPFVTTWSFHRQASVVAPGLTLCIPSRFHRSKVKAANEAYQMLEEINTGRDNLMDFPTTPPPRHSEEKCEEWRRQLLNTSIIQARHEIGFTSSDVIKFARATHQGRSHDLTKRMFHLETGSETCWSLNYFSAEIEPEATSQEGLDDEVEESNTDEGGQRSRGNVESGDKMLDIGGNFVANDTSYNNYTPSVQAATREGGEDLGFKDSSTSNGETRIEPSESYQSISTVLTEFPSPENSLPLSETTMDKEITLSEVLTEPSVSTPSSTVDNERSSDPEGREIETGSVTEEDKNSFLRLNMEDSILFTICLNQYEWLGDPEYAGLQLYVHDQKGAYWTTKPMLLRPGSYNKIYFRNVRYKFLPLPFKSFAVSRSRQHGDSSHQHKLISEGQGSAGCVDTASPDFENPIVSVQREFYTVEACLLEVANNLTVAKCGCVTTSSDQALHGVGICSVLTFYECFFVTIGQEYARLEKLIADSGESESGANDSFRCPQQCEITSFKTFTSSGDFPSASRLKRYSKYGGFDLETFKDNYLVVEVKPEGPLSETVEHVAEITLLDVIGTIGGYMGLCLGASLLSLTELGQAGISCLWIIFRKLANRVSGSRQH